jgi:hypothetical protein
MDARPRVLHPYPEARFAAQVSTVRAVSANERMYGSVRGY